MAFLVMLIRTPYGEEFSCDQNCPVRHQVVTGLIQVGMERPSGRDLETGIPALSKRLSSIVSDSEIC